MTTPSSIPAPHPAQHANPRDDVTSGLRFLEELVQHISSRSSYAEEGSSHTFAPRFDVEIHPDSYELYGELPGFDHDHVTVEANDDRNIQISGWISRNRQADPATDPRLAVLHHDPPAVKPKVLATARFGDELDPRAEFVHDSPRKTSDVTSPAAAAAATPPPVGPATARFGDELDPHVEFVHDPPASSVAHTDPTPAAVGKAASTRPETARFGDELDPHAQYVHRPKAAAAGAAAAHTHYLMAERRYGQFHRAFHFPGPFKKEEVSARMDNGILHVTVPKKAVGPVTKVVVRKGGEGEGRGAEGGK